MEEERWGCRRNTSKSQLPSCGRAALDSSRPGRCPGAIYGPVKPLLGQVPTRATHLTLHLIQTSLSRHSKHRPPASSLMGPAAHLSGYIDLLLLYSSRTPTPSHTPARPEPEHLARSHLSRLGTDVQSAKQRSESIQPPHPTHLQQPHHKGPLHHGTKRVHDKAPKGNTTPSA